MDASRHPGSIVAYLDKRAFAPLAPFADGRQVVGDLTTSTAFYSPRSGVHTPAGAMLKAWQPEFGFPMTVEYPLGGNCLVRCEHATLRRDADGAVSVQRS